MTEQLIRAGFVDLDGTAFRGQWFYEFIKLAVKRGVFKGIAMSKPKQHFHAYKNRESPFSPWVNAQVNAYQEDGRLAGISVSDMESVADELARKKGKLVHVFPRELVRAMKEVGWRPAIVSGSMIEAVAAFARVWGVSIYLGTIQPRDETGTRYTGGMQKEWCLEKGNAIRLLAETHDLDVARSLAIGDAMTDVEMFELVKYPICFNPNQKLLSVARQRQWPVVWERKDVCSFFRPGRDGKLHEVSIDNILPKPLATTLEERLTKRFAP